ncbi:MAG: 2OG-Fe(II) oxygenase [Ilumatobacteraceae bacterium]
MVGVPREELAALLVRLRGDGSFATRRTAPAADLVINVKGVGQLKLPLPASHAKELRLVARPAKYGHGEHTILDRRVRDTWEVPRSRVRIDQRRWNLTLHPMLDSIRDDLALPAASVLTAQLHSMLVYESGQFFAPHQDSEKNDEMIGTLVVMLPSRSSGGDLVVEHRKRSVRYSGSATALTFVAFYADTRHEVLPVETGHRVVLTYNLLLTGDTAASHVGETHAEAAAELLHRHFAQAPPPRWHNDHQANDPPDRLVVLLDHQYTERGLRWSHLKGDDATRVETLRAAAQLADCEIALGQADVHETRECYDDAPPRRRHRGWSDWAGEPTDASTDFEVGDVLDSEVTITPAAGEAHRFESNVDAGELAEVTPTFELSPYDSEHTGYMGNWGNTMDRWYRRAAVVIWPRSRTFAIRAKGDPSGALDDLLADSVTDEPSRATRAERVETLLRFWPDAVRTDTKHLLHARALRLAWELADEDLATRLLQPFTIEALTPDDATVLVALVEQHGLDWYHLLLSSWFAPPRAWAPTSPALTRTAWTATLPDLCAALRDDPHSPAGLGTNVARALAQRSSDWLLDAVRQAASIATPSRRDATLESLAVPTVALLRASGSIDATALRSQIDEVVCDPTLRLVPMLVDVVRSAMPMPPRDRQLARTDTIAAHCRNALDAELSLPLRAPDDWSITGFQPGTCCADCAALAAFLADPAAKQATWPLAKPRRQHLHQRIDETELPVTHTTIRQGSPHKLVLTKTAEVHLRDTQRRRSALDALTVVTRYLGDST